MSWEYRIVRDRYYGDEHFLIKEIYYDENNNIIATGSAPVPHGEDISEIKGTISLMNKAIEKEVIDIPLFQDSRVYCTNCINGLNLIKSIKNDTDLPVKCNGCNPDNPEDCTPYKDRPNYKLR